MIQKDGTTDTTNSDIVKKVFAYLEEQSVDTSSIMCRVSCENTDDLPQTGVPWARAAEGLAVVLTVGGAIIALKSRKK